jgi:hypothetical protein
MNFRNLFLSIATGFIFTTSHANAEDVTNTQSIQRIQYNGNTQALYFVGESKWSSANCPNATYVQVKSDITGWKEIMSIGLAAKMGGTEVSFWGECDTNNDYFNAFYVVIH